MDRHDRKIGALGRALLGALFVLMIGCQRAEMRGKLVVIPHKISGLLWLSEHLGIVEAAQRHHLNVEWGGPSDDDYTDQQYDLTDRAIREGAEGVVLSPDANWMFRREMILARDRHVPVVLEGDSAGIEASPGISLVLGDSAETGRLIAARLGKQLNHRGEVMIVSANAHAPGMQARSDAIAAALASTEPNILVASSMLDTGSTAHSEMLMYQALMAHPRIQAIVALSPEETLAAARVARVSNRLAEMHVVGCDQSPQVLTLLRLGVLDSLLVQDNRRQGELAVDVVSDMRAGRYSSRTVYVPPVLVTLDNIASEPIQQLLLMHR